MSERNERIISTAPKAHRSTARLDLVGTHDAVVLL